MEVDIKPEEHKTSRNDTDQEDRDNEHEAEEQSEEKLKEEQMETESHIPLTHGGRPAVINSNKKKILIFHL